MSSKSYSPFMKIIYLLLAYVVIMGMAYEGNTL